MLGQCNWVWPISPLWHEVFGKRFNLLWYNFLLLGKFSFAQIAKDWTNHPAIWLRRPLTFPLIQHLTSLILQSLFILAENSDWFRTVDLWYWMQLLCHVLLYPSQTPSYSFSHTHTHNFLLFLSHTLWNELTHIILAIQKAYFLLPLRLSRAALQEKQESDSKANSNLLQKQTFQFNSNGLFWR